MGGKTATSTAQVQIPPEIMAQYNAVNAKAEQAAATPFQTYSNNPDAFVAPLTGTQQAGIQNTNAAQGMYKPFYNAATQSMQGAQDAADPLQAGAAQNIQYGQGLGGAYNNAATNLSAGALGAANPYNSSATSLIGQSAGAVNPTALGAAEIGQYMSPFNEGVVQSTMRNLQQQQQQEQSSLQGDQIMKGAFGGDRGGVASANLARQQDMASGQVLSQLYNQNYGQALGAAQQQQGVNLGAGQANRQALGAAGQSMGQLGQQIYGQRSGTAGQMAQIGQQAYGQALGAANAQSGLGNQVFNQGAQASQQYQNLGNGAQANALTGAQAQLGAGQVEQQTQQAGTQALYNQFLQQQGYPFQVAQFLGGIAMGTGALSGSTTTNTQPTSFFGGLSDARMKENMQPVGKTFDGQPIIKFNYKGQKRKQIGLIAQEVEKSHPDAVREDGGVKYVDYDRATKGAERDRFADGGAAADPTTMAEIARMQRAMYPWMSEEQSRTGGGAGPHGMALMQLPNAKLQTAEAPTIKDPGLHGAVQSIEDVGKTVDMGKDAYKFIQGLGGAKSDSSGDADAQSTADLIDEVTKNRGGLVAARGAFSKGGLPYKDGDDGYVPVDDDFDKESRKLDAPKAPDASGGGGGLGDLVKAGKSIASLAAMFNRGGRTGYADSGAVDSEHMVVPGGEDELDRVASENDPNAPPYPGLAKAKNWISHAVSGVAPIFGGGEKIPAKEPAAEIEQPAVKAPSLGAAKFVHMNAQPAPVPEKMPDAAPPAEISAPAAGLGNAEIPTEKEFKPIAPEKDSAAPSGGDKKGDWMQRNQHWLVPLLKGVGTMAASPSRYLGAALLQGAGAAAGSYEDVQNQMTKRDQTQSTTEGNLATIAGAAYNKDLNAVRVYDAHGNMVYIPKWEYMRNFQKGVRYKLAPLGTGSDPAPGAQPAGPPGETAPPAAGAIAGTAPPVTGAPEIFPATTASKVDQVAQNMIERRVDAASATPDMTPFGDIAASARTAYEIDPQTKQLASALSRVASDKSGGPLTSSLMPIGQYVNDALRRLGVDYQVADPTKLADMEEINKINRLLAANAAKSGNQHAYASLESIMESIPSSYNSPQGMGHLIADIMVQQQRSKDLGTFANKWREQVASKTYDQNLANVSGAGLEQEFTNVNNARYGAEKKMLEDIFHKAVRDKTTGQSIPMIDFLTAHGKDLTPGLLDQLNKTYPGIGRYFNIGG